MRVKDTATEIFIGAPIFSNDPRAPFRAPIGQREICLAVRQETQDPKEILVKLSIEYISVLLTLKKMGISFRIIYAHSKLILPKVSDFLKKENFDFLEFPNLDVRTVTFPRDLATQLPDGTLLINSDLPRPRQVYKKKKSRVIRSPYGEGGRVFIRRGIALVSERIYLEGKTDLRGDCPPVEPIEKTGLKLGFLPNATNFEIYSHQDRTICAFEPVDHLDRIGGLLEDRNGGLHLIVDPQMHSGLRNLSEWPHLGPKETLTKYRTVCDELGIKLHVPEKLSVPASICFVQFKNNKVLMTSGDDEIETIVAEIVGRDNLFLTPVPIRYYPAWPKAGIRCLIGEFPSFVHQLWNYK